MSDSEVAKSHFKMAFNGILVAVRVPSCLVENRPLFEKLLIMKIPDGPISLNSSAKVVCRLESGRPFFDLKKSKL